MRSRGCWAAVLITMLVFGYTASITVSETVTRGVISDYNVYYIVGPCGQQLCRYKVNEGMAEGLVNASRLNITVHTGYRLSGGCIGCLRSITITITITVYGAGPEELNFTGSQPVKVEQHPDPVYEKYTVATATATEARSGDTGSTLDDSKTTWLAVYTAGEKRILWRITVKAKTWEKGSAFLNTTYTVECGTDNHGETLFNNYEPLLQFPLMIVAAAVLAFITMPLLLHVLSHPRR